MGRNKSRFVCCQVSSSDYRALQTRRQQRHVPTRIQGKSKLISLCAARPKKCLCARYHSGYYRFYRPVLHMRSAFWRYRAGKSKEEDGNHSCRDRRETARLGRLARVIRLCLALRSALCKYKNFPLIFQRCCGPPTLIFIIETL